MEPEIIDLTESSPSPPNIVDLTSDVEDAAPSNPAPTPSAENGMKKSRKRKKKKVRTTENGQPSTVAAASTENMPTSSAGATRTHDTDAASTSASRRDDTSQLYFIDVIPVPLPPPIAQLQPETQESQPGTLLLPAHVAVFGNDSIQIVSPTQKELGEEDYIEYLAYDDYRDVPRYFEDQSKEETKHSKVVCKNCGAEGEHKTSACPVIVCLTCGAHNEHGTRSCPIGKVCFACGMKGHITSTCPNRYAARGRNVERYAICERCDSRLHNTNECPSWWRIYEYVTDEERSQITEQRKGKKDLQLGSGGEGYIGRDPWCYNCAGIGHWGDDCDELPHRYDRLEEPSAFSLHNVMCGPFYDPEKELATTFKDSRSHRRNDDIFDDWSKDVPSEVGKQGRKKNMARLEKRAREQERDDEDNWFDKPGDIKIRGQAKHDDKRRDEPRKASKFSFGKSVAEAGRRLGGEDSKPSSLLSRITDDRGGRGRDDGRHRDRDRYRDKHDRYDNNRYDRDRDRRRWGHDRDRESEYHERSRDRYQNRPRYKGGYKK